MLVGLKAIRIHPGLLREIRAKPAAQRRQIGERIAEAQRCIGQPHSHRRVGLRKLQDEWYEIRVGLKKRLVFENAPATLVFEFLGNHDEVKRFLNTSGRVPNGYSPSRLQNPLTGVN